MSRKPLDLPPKLARTFVRHMLEGCMLLRDSLGAVFVCLSLSMAWAEDKPDEPAFPFSKWTFRWDYSCPTAAACSFICPTGGTGLTSHIIKLRVYLGTISVDSQSAPALFYEFSTREFLHGSGFKIGSGLTTLACEVHGMILDDSGPPK
jgi:hypothetical protein